MYNDYPSIAYEEVDSSVYTPQVSSAGSKAVGIVGYSSWGDPDSVIEINLGEKPLKIGYTLSDYPLSGLLVDSVLNAGGKVYFKRINRASAVQATNQIVVQAGTKASYDQNFSSVTSAAFEDDESVALTWVETFEGETPVTRTVSWIPGDTGTHTLAEFVAAVTSQFANFACEIVVSSTTHIVIREKAYGGCAISGVTGTMLTKWTTSGAATTVAGVAGVSITCTAAYKGSNGNNFSCKFERIKDVGVSTTYEYNFYILFKDTIIKQFKDIELFDSTDEQYLPTLLSTNVDYIDFTFTGFDGTIFSQNDLDALVAIYDNYDVDDNPDPSPGYIEKDLASGTDDIPTAAADIQTDLSDAVGEFTNLAEGSFRLLIAAYDFTDDAGSKTVWDAFAGAALARKDCVFISSTPKGLDEDDTQTYANTTIAANTSYAALYSNYGKTFDSVNNQKVDTPSIINVVKNFLALTYWWNPCAGYDNGVVDISEIDTIWNEQTAMPKFQGGRNAINPILKENFGYYINGQKTTQRANTALNRLNVRFAMIELSQTILSILRNFSFRYNDSDTRDNLLSILETYKTNYITNKAFTSIDYICDETNNTDDVINDNGFIVDVHVVPVKTAEKFLLRVTLHEYGWTIEELAA